MSFVTLTDSEHSRWPGGFWLRASSAALAHFRHIFVLSESGAPHSVNQINTQLNGRPEREEYHSFQNKLSLGAGGSHTGISESLKLVGDSCGPVFP